MLEREEDHSAFGLCRSGERGEIFQRAIFVFGALIFRGRMLWRRLRLPLMHFELRNKPYNVERLQAAVRASKSPCDREARSLKSE
jgi:hypothetical protein